VIIFSGVYIIVIHFRQTAAPTCLQMTATFVARLASNPSAIIEPLLTTAVLKSKRRKNSKRE
jgi:hypothetical protein